VIIFTIFITYAIVFGIYTYRVLFIITYLFTFTVTYASDRAVAQAVTRWLLTAAARVRTRQHVAFVVDKTALGQVSSQ
jgi:hypothetical protein